MDIGEIEKIGDRELPGIPVFPKTLPMPVPPQRQPEPERSTPTPTKQPEKVPA